MAINDVKIKDSVYENVPTWTWQVDASATLIYPGEPVKLYAAGSPYVVKLADAEPVIGTTTQVIGIAKSTSTNTASAAGTVEVYMPLPGIVYSIAAKSAAAANTQSEIDALCGDTLLFDLTSTTFTIDTAAGTAVSSGLQVVGGDPTNSNIYFTIRQSACFGATA